MTNTDLSDNTESSRLTTSQNLGHFALANTESTPPVTFGSFPAPPAKRWPLQRGRLALLVTICSLLIITSGGVTLALLHKTSHRHSTIAASVTKKPVVALKPSTPVTVPQTKSTPQAGTPQNVPIRTSTSQPHTASTLPAGSSSYTGSLPNSVPIYVSGGNNYYYAGGRQLVTASGASVTLSQFQPLVGQSAGTENHSLMEMSASSADGQQIVEIGWIVDQIMNGDAAPHLFVYHWSSGQTSCYNGCGFVQTPGSVIPGAALAVNTSGNFGISYSSNAWYLSYNGSTVGYFPESLWNGGFTQLGLVQTFGEVEISPKSTTQCIQMGNGIAGSSAGSAQISNFTLIGSSSGAALSPYATTASPYSYGSASATGVNIGGPGSC